jgi:hypothetical protein
MLWGSIDVVEFNFFGSQLGKFIMLELIDCDKEIWLFNFKSFSNRLISLNWEFLDKLKKIFLNTLYGLFGYSC